MREWALVAATAAAVGFVAGVTVSEWTPKTVMVEEDGAGRIPVNWVDQDGRPLDGRVFCLAGEPCGMNF